MRLVSKRSNTPDTVQFALFTPDGAAPWSFDLPVQDAYPEGYGLSTRGSTICGPAAITQSGYDPDYWRNRTSTLYTISTHDGHVTTLTVREDRSSMAFGRR